MGALLEKLRDTTARKPSGWFGKLTFNYPKGLNRSFPIILEKLNLRSDDAYLEVACGAGQLLQMALETVHRAAAIDHSPDMIEVARRRNRAAVEKGMVEIVEGKAESMPWADEQFSCAACVNAFFFMEHPFRVIVEIYRVLKPGGRLAISAFGKKPSLYGMIFKRPYGVANVYSDDEMRSMLHQAGFTTVEVQSKGAKQLCYAQR